MARKKKRKIVLTQKNYMVIILMVIILGLILLISNRTKLKKPEHNVKLHETEAEIYIGDVIRLGYTILNQSDEDKLIWSTSNSKIATVDQYGRIRGISFGDVIITVELSNGNSSSLKLRVKSYPVYLRINTDIKPTKGWFNKPVNITLDFLNIENIKYCVTLYEICEPNIKYKDKINLKNGNWQLYVKGLDRNNKEILHKEMFKIDLVPPKCNITRIGKLNEETATITVLCNETASGIDSFEWYRDDKRVYITENEQVFAKDIYDLGKHKYSVKVYDGAGNFATYEIN